MAPSEKDLRWRAADPARRERQREKSLANEHSFEERLRGLERSREAISHIHRFRGAGWEAMRARLAAFATEHGNCLVPQRHAADPKLGKWVMNQRARKKRLYAGQRNPKITVERVAKLDALGFEWAPGFLPFPADEVGWEAQRAKLAAYAAEHGDCCVPQRYAPDRKLGSWVNLCSTCLLPGASLILPYRRAIRCVKRWPWQAQGPPTGPPGISQVV